MIWNHVWSQKEVFQTLDYVIKLIWRKSMSINYIFVGQQVCKQTHTHAKLYRTHSVLHLFRMIFFVHCTALTKSVKGARAHHLAIYSSSISRLPSAMSLHTVAHRNMSTTRLYRYYRGKTNSYRGENFYRYIANDKKSPIPAWKYFYL